MKAQFERLSLDWLQEVISEDGSLYRLVSFDENKKVNEILESYASEAYDERLDLYAQRAVNTAAEIFLVLYDDFAKEADDFLEEVEKILSALKSAICFTEKWKATKVNPEIDNTR